MKKVQVLDLIRSTKLAPRDRWLLSCLIQRMRKETGFVCWPSEATIASDTGYNRKTVRAGIASLIGLGLIRPDGTVRSRHGGTPVKRYALQLDALKAIATVPLVDTPSVYLVDTEDSQCVPSGQPSVQSEPSQCVPSGHELLIGTTKENYKENLPSQEVAVLDLPVPVKAKPAAKIEYSEDFLQFWDMACLKTGKMNAAKAYSDALGHVDQETLLAAWAEANRAWGTWPPDRNLPHPSTWLNQHRWEDAPPKPMGAAAPQRGMSQSDRFQQLAEQMRKDKQEPVSVNSGWLGTLLVQEG